MMNILLELGLVIGLVGLGPKVLRSGTLERPLSIFVLVVGVLAALGILGIRLSLIR
jgi:hypothetical protein